MTVFLLSLVFFIVIVLAMAVGYIFQQKTIAGSCGGLASLGVEKACDCDTPCEKRLAREKKAKLAQEKIDVKLL